MMSMRLHILLLLLLVQDAFGNPTTSTGSTDPTATTLTAVTKPIDPSDSTSPKLIIPKKRRKFTKVTVDLRAEPNATELKPTCESEIYCKGQLLHTIQMAGIHRDSKTFVDMSLRFKPEEILKNFNDMMKENNDKPSLPKIKAFVNKNFEEEAQLEMWEPTDFKSEPAFLEKITKRDIKDFAKKIVGVWGDLGRKVKNDVKVNPEKHSLIYVPNGFIIPGGRFKEYYYWDSYWVLKGLVLSEMYETQRGMLENFLHMVDQYGFVPNGGRVYYLNRSQPPLLLKMAKEFVDTTSKLGWLRENIHLLERECEFWMENQFVQVKVNGKEYKMATYATKSQGPRPESYKEDVVVASIFKTEAEKQELYNELKAAAQSGWDFSSRWIFDPNGGTNANRSFTVTSRVIPVDLNAILYEAFFDLAELYQMLGNESEHVSTWDSRAVALKDAIHNVLWDEEDGTWYDFDRIRGVKRKMFMASNLTPLWTKAYDLTNKENIGAKVADYLRREGITDFKGGIPASKQTTNEQWDMPNAWPPSQFIIVHGLLDTGEEQAREIAIYFLRWWVTANFRGYEKSKTLYEKYDALTPGLYGGGGEYDVQDGFGWTNGVVLDFINLYYSTGNRGNHCNVNLVLFYSVSVGLIVIGWYQRGMSL